MAIDHEIDNLCDAFEATWGTEGSPRIEDLLPRVESAKRPTLLTELIKVDIDLHQSPNLLERRADYRQRFPDYANAVELAIREVTARQLPNAPWRNDESERILQAGERIGKYEICQLLGSGAFGAVYLARDSEIERQIAIKIPRRGQLANELEIQQLLHDARLVGQLRHPGIVRVYEAGSTDGLPYIVEEYLPGGDLKNALAKGQPAFPKAAELIMLAADALEAAHLRGIFHRDLKPSNILLDAEGKPCIADFGLAMRDQSRHLHLGEVCGAPPYMAPEQVRGESHRIDGRSDLWSLGVIFYELLTGSRPFDGEDQAELFAEIKDSEPVAPRMHSAEIPAELERICMKCLAKRMSDRYPNARSLAADLRGWLSFGDRQRQELPANAPVLIRPKGLQSFDETDADYYLQLVPGPRNAEGIPDSIRFWVSRLGELNADKTFPVGLLYGPSGSGKSSFVRAGLLPRLSKEHTVIYVEATAEETELRILKQLRKSFPHLPVALDFPQTLAFIRDDELLAPNGKVIFVLDQFEQWLHANPTLEESQLVDGLRQCDGGRIQALVMVRDEFWMGITRLMRSLEIELVQGDNADSVDRFDLSHARKVLRAFGEAYGHAHPVDPVEREAQDKFLDLAVRFLAENDRVISVRLALFADMVKDKPWRPETLPAKGETDGVGVDFLDDAFNTSRSNPSHRIHAEAARRVLECLLPDAGTDIKGQMRSISELRAASHYQDEERSFEELLNILDRRLRLITPTDPISGPIRSEQVAKKSAGTHADAESHFQLTHDFLVPALRTWTYRKDKETWQGRARLRMKERAELWSSRRESQQLPPLWEWTAMVAGTHRADRTEKQQEMIKVAGRHLAVRWSIAVALVLVIVLGMFSIRDTIRRAEAEQLIVSLMQATPEGVPQNIERLKRYDDIVVPILHDADELTGLTDSDVLSTLRARLNIEHAIAQLDQPNVARLLKSLHLASLSQMQIFATSLAGREDDVLAFWERVRDGESRTDKLKVVLLLMHMGNSTGLQHIMADKSDPQLGTELLLGTPDWNPDLTILVRFLLSDDADVQTGICAIIAGVSPDDVSTATRRFIEVELPKLFTASPSAAVHSASQFAMMQWGIALPEIPKRKDALKGFEWFVNAQGHTMVQLPEYGTPEQPSYMANAETSALQYQKYVHAPKDTSHPLVQDPTKATGPAPTGSRLFDCPIQDMTVEDAILYCNELSEIDGLEACYAKDKTGKYVLVPGAYGYRLPLKEEWQHAYRAGTSTLFFFGSDPDFLSEYAVVRAQYNARVASRRPNPWGFYDMDGNVGEMCFNIASRNSGGLTYCGRAATDALNVHGADAYMEFDSNVTHSNTVGFRIVLGKVPEAAHESEADTNEDPQ